MGATEQPHYGAVADVATPWRRLARDLYTTPEWLASYEGPGPDRAYTVLPGTGTPRLAVVSDVITGGGPLFDDPASLLHTDPVDITPHLHPDERRQLDHARAVSRESWMPDAPRVVSVLPGAFLPGVVRGDPSDRHSAERAVDVVEARARGAGAHSVAFAHVRAGDRTLRDVLEDRGYSFYTCVADCVLRTPWRSFDAYLGAMTERRRSRVRREIRDFASKGAKLVDADPAALGEQHALLNVTHMTKYGHVLTPVRSEQILRRIAHQLHATVRLLEVRSGGRLVAFLLYHAAHGKLYPKLLGMSDDVKDAAPYAYFQLCYYAMVDRAVSGGFREIVLGPESYGAKALRGCRYEARVHYVRFPGRPPNLTDRVATLLDQAYRSRLESQPWAPL